jgi:hypothetical protein
MSAKAREIKVKTSPAAGLLDFMAIPADPALR